jgi:peroxiredoxin Q/BCP
MADKLKPGDPAPDFRLTADDGRTVSLGDFHDRWLALYFFPKAFTPG